MKSLLVQYLLLCQFRRSAKKYGAGLRERLSFSQIEAKHKLKFNFKDSLKHCRDFFESILQVHKKDKKKATFGSQKPKNGLLLDAYNIFNDFCEILNKGK